MDWVNRSGGIRAAVIIASAWNSVTAATEPTGKTETLVRVNGRAVTQADLETAYLMRGVAAEHRPTLRRPLLERLVEEALIAAFLERQGVRPNPASLETQVDRLLALIRRRGEDPDTFLPRLGLDRQQIERQLSLPLAWETYAREMVTSAHLQAYFASHRRELDGTQLRARHIVLKIPADATADEWDRATQRLEMLRQEIQSNSRTFDEAAREFSEGPSGEKGGDVGFFAFRGTMPAAFADAAFQLKPGELSRPVRDRFGVHLIEVTEERPGQLSLEDVREAVFQRLAADLWDKQVQSEQSRARIEWTDPADSQRDR
ncbi:MAG: peptidylprolyl isomerase [Planctomycetaceae bacterium]